MKLPRWVLVGPYKYKITRDQAEIDRAGHVMQSELFGWTSHDDTRIVLSPNMSPEREAATLLHEILHCAWEAAGLPGKQEERCVNALAPILLQTLRSNPDVVAYLEGTR